MQSKWTIYKYPLVLNGPTQMPHGAQLLAVQEQHGEAFVWARVDPSEPPAWRSLWVAGTGLPLPTETDDVPYIGTFQLGNGALVFHVFDCGEAES
jgi:hypothetical protein